MLYLAPLVPLVAMVLVPPLPHSSQRLDSDPYHGPSFYILYTTLPPVLLGGVPFLVLISTFLNIGFVFARGSVELPTPDPVLEFHATSFLSITLQPGLRSFARTVPSSYVVSMVPQTTHSDVHPIVSCSPRELYFSIFDLDPMEFHQESLRSP